MVRHLPNAWWLILYPLDLRYTRRLHFRGLLLDPPSPNNQRLNPPHLHQQTQTVSIRLQT